MKNNLSILLCIPLILLGINQAWTETQILDFIKIIVNDEILTNNEFQEALASNRSQILQNIPEGPDRQRQLSQLENTTIENLIYELLILDQAKVLNIEVSDDEIEQQINRLTQENSQIIKNYDLQVLKELIAREMLKQKVIIQEIEVKIHVTDPEIEMLCLQNKEESKKLVIAQILFRGTEEEARSKEALIKKALSEGEDFATLAETYSDDPNVRETAGIIGSFKKGELLPEIDNVAFSLNPRELSKLVKTEIGYHLLFLQDVEYNEEIDCANLTETEKIQYKNQIFLQKREVDFQTYLSKLRDAAQVVIH